MEAPDLRRAVEAATATVSALGLQADDTVVITNSDRIVARLLPCDVLARVAPLAHRAGSEFEVEIARRLAEVGAPVAELDPRAEPRLWVRDGFAISLWTYYEPVGSDVAPSNYASALAGYHAALRQTDLRAPHVADRTAGALREVSDPRATPELSDADRELLVSTLSLAITGGNDQLLHGEPHPGNLINTARGPLFVDLATCCRGPVEFDLAHAPEEVARHYPAVDLARPHPQVDLDLLRRCRAVTWALFSTWRWRPDDQLPDRPHWRREGLDRVRAYL